MLCARGAKIVRLDAFGYVTKIPGTRCFFEEPQVWHLLDMVERIVHEQDTGCAQTLCLNTASTTVQPLWHDSQGWDMSTPCAPIGHAGYGLQRYFLVSASNRLRQCPA